MTAPEGTLCTKTHEYVLKEDSLVKVGITDFAVGELGDIVFVELPDVGSEFSKGDVFGTIESVKAASELYTPISGKIVEVNEKLISEPELINSDCFGEGWLIKVEGCPEDELTELLSYDEYQEYLEEE